MAGSGGACTLELKGTGAERGMFDASITPVMDAGGLPMLDSGPAFVADAADAPPGPLCDLAGRFALHVIVDVSWKGTKFANFFPVLDEDQGQIDIVALVDAVRSDDTLHFQVRACDVRTPDFASTTIGETYGVQFPEPIWEAGSMPNWQIPVGVACEDPGCSLEAEPLLALLGLTLDEPDGTWPTSRNDPRFEYYDHDDDGFAGLTVKALGPESTSDDGVPYAHPPVLSLLKPAERALQLRLGVRFATRFSGQIDDCDHFSGVGHDTLVNARAVGCTYSNLAGNHSCDGEQSDFVDGNLPDWESVSAKLSGSRLTPTASCADARAAAYGE